MKRATYSGGVHLFGLLSSDRMFGLVFLLTEDSFLLLSLTFAQYFFLSRIICYPQLTTSSVISFIFPIAAILHYIPLNVLYPRSSIKKSVCPFIDSIHLPCSGPLGTWIHVPCTDTLGICSSMFGKW